jgi:Holliday junction resolvase
MKPPPTESRVEAKIVTYARSKGCLVYKFSSPARRGVPDRIIIAPGGKVLFLEIKRPGKVPTELQMREIRLLTEQGCHATWTNSVNGGKTCVDWLVSV